MDWIYTPIIALHSKDHKRDDEAEEAQKTFVVSYCLRWVLLYETYFPQLADKIEVTEKYCRLACVFLGSDSLFLIPEVHMFLEACFRILIKHEAKLDFDKQIRGKHPPFSIYLQSFSLLHMQYGVRKV